MKCFYHNDLDGKCSAHWVYRNVGIHDLFDDGMISIDYTDEFPFDIIKPNEQVWIVDFSISPDDMRRLISITNDITWIDHHKTAIEKYKDFEFQLRGVRYDGFAGCELTYAYIHHMTARGDGVIKNFNENMLKDAPMFTKFVGDWDLWKFKYGDDTKFFKSGIESYDTSPSSSTWINVELDYKKYIEIGKTIERFKSNHYKEMVRDFSFEVQFEGYNCIACNAGKVSKMLFDSCSKQYDIYIPFVFNGNIYRVSLYSRDDIDVSEIAKKYGGGGHKNASGFECKKLPFQKMSITPE